MYSSRLLLTSCFLHLRSCSLLMRFAFCCLLGSIPTGFSSLVRAITPAALIFQVNSLPDLVASSALPDVACHVGPTCDQACPMSPPAESEAETESFFVDSDKVKQTFFCSTSVLLASTRWVQLTFFKPSNIQKFQR